MFKPTIEPTRRGQVYRRLGTFWTKLFGNQSQVRSLVALSRQTQIFSQLESVTNNWAGDHASAAHSAQVVVNFKGADVFQTGAHYFGDTYNYPGNSGFSRKYDTFRLQYYGLFLPATILPEVIQSQQGKLILGIDFFIQAGRFILFRKNPIDLFPQGYYLVERGENRKYQPYTNYLTRSTSRQPKYSINYRRIAQTPQAFQLALAAEAGMKILGSTQKLQQIVARENRTLYVFENESLEVDYFHEPLTVGQTYARDYIIGEGIKVFQGDAENKNWWRAVDWRGGISLDPLIAQRGLVVLDKDVLAYSAGAEEGSAAGSKLHARVQLFDQYPDQPEFNNARFATENAYWSEVAVKEKKTGYYLNGILQLPEDVDSGDPTRSDTFAKLLDLNAQANEINLIMGKPFEAPDIRSLPNNKIVNALDTFFEAVLKKRAFVITVDQSKVKNSLALNAFIVRELPLGCAPVILGYAPQLPIESGRAGATIGGTNSVTVQNTIPLALNAGGPASGRNYAFIT